MVRQIDLQIDRQTDTCINFQTDKQIPKQIDIMMERQTDKRITEKWLDERMER